MRNHIIDFLVTRSKTFAAEMAGRGFDRRHVPVVRPGAPEPVIAAEQYAFPSSSAKADDPVLASRNVMHGGASR